MLEKTFQSGRPRSDNVQSQHFLTLYCSHAVWSLLASTIRRKLMLSVPHLLHTLQYKCLEFFIQLSVNQQFAQY